MADRSAIVVLGLIASPIVSLAQSGSSSVMKSLDAVRVQEPITIDGLLDEASWTSAAVVEDVHQILPVEYAEPSQRSLFLVLYDDEALYLAGKMYDDEPELITANVLRGKNGDSWRDDQFYVYLDPFNNKRSGYLFQINPNGVFEEGIFRGPTQVQWEWEGNERLRPHRTKKVGLQRFAFHIKRCRLIPMPIPGELISDVKLRATMRRWGGYLEIVYKARQFRAKLLG